MGKRILIFDDDVELISILEYITNENGWQLFSQTNCDDLLKQTRAVKPDVILMDNWLPGIGGIRATQTLKKEDDLKHIPVIYFSANNNIESLAANAGADTFIAKPFELDELEKVIRQYLSE